MTGRVDHETAVYPVRGLTPPQHRVVCTVCGWLIRVPDVQRAFEIARLHSERADHEDGPVAQFRAGKRTDR